jgi:hypothetical protein
MVSVAGSLGSISIGLMGEPLRYVWMPRLRSVCSPSIVAAIDRATRLNSRSRLTWRLENYSALLNERFAPIVSRRVEDGHRARSVSLRRAPADSLSSRSWTLSRFVDASWSFGQRAAT